MSLRYGFIALLLAVPALVHAQESAAVLAAKAHLQADALARGADLTTSDVIVDRRTGATFVYLSQSHDGIPVVGTVTPVAVTASGRVLGSAAPAAFMSGIAARANASTPAVEAEAAVTAAMVHARALHAGDAVELRAVSDDVAADAAALSARRANRDTYTLIGTPRLVYQPVADGSLRLAWDVTVESVSGHAMWAMRMDAQTGAALAADDLIDRHTVAEAGQGLAPARSYAPLAAPSPVSAQMSGTYRVVPFPFESPTHGAFSLAVTPHNAVASQLGWHNDGTTTYTVTRGNNAWAYEDRSASGSGTSAAETSPGAYDYPYDPALAPGAGTNTNAAITNVFYWGNLFHDVMWHYGLDEAGGNFQTNNFGRGGAGNDAVRLEAQDGSGTNNANFSTPADGGAGRMQMYEWEAPPVFTVTAPATIADTYLAGAPNADFPNIPNGVSSGAVTVGLNSLSAWSQGCTTAEVTNGAAMSGTIAVFRRGNCTFASKMLTAQALGATGVIISNCDVEEDPGCTGANPGEVVLGMACNPPDPCGTITTRAAFVAKSTGDLLFTTQTGITATLEIGGTSRDSDFDAGIIAHEYGHGVSNRLVGGPAVAGCLGNQEQMGEGWSDYFGMMVTQQPGDTPEQRRGVGTYVEFQSTSGPGIRPAPYSTDFGVNNFTYQDVITQGGTGLSVPHGIGFVWATMLWDMTWNIIATNGYSADIYDAAGTAGNQIAMNLVTTGLKMTACSPGFVSGRDAILEADTLLYGGQYSNAIWTAFAGRGLGVNASQGSTANVNDGMADFTMPVVATEQTATGGTVSLVVAGPNPARSATAVALTLDAAQSVRVEVLDLLGRAVATLHDGPLAADGAHRLAVPTAGLAPGVYVVRAVGEGFSLAERITVTR